MSVTYDNLTINFEDILFEVSIRVYTPKHVREDDYREVQILNVVVIDSDGVSQEEIDDIIDSKSFYLRVCEESYDYE